jgi:hypothetical protein
MTLSKETLIPASLIVGLIAAAVSYGVLSNKVEQSHQDIVEMKSQLTKNTALLNRVVGKLDVTLSAN